MISPDQGCPWVYQGLPFEVAPEDYIGFVYLITCIPTDQKYIGRKIFLSAKKKAPLKGKTRARRTKVDSNWKNYYGSSDYMKQLVIRFGKQSFKREIVRLCKSKSEMSYYETKLIFETDALIRDNYINRWLTAQINGNNLAYLKDSLTN